MGVIAQGKNMFSKSKEEISIGGETTDLCGRDRKGG